MNTITTKTLFQQYEKYKDSGVEWIGEIPEGWEVVKGKRLLFENKRAVRKEDEIVTCFRDGQVTLRRLRKTEGFTNSLKEIGYQGIRAGDLVVHNMDAFAGAIGIAEYDGKSTPVYSVCTERNNNTLHLKFYSYYLRNLAVRGLILSLAKGIRERSTDFRFSDLGDLDLPYPPLSEQTTIAQFLDDKTAKIDQLIGIKQKEIELLKERRQILIQQAVTGKWSMVNGQWLKTQTEKLKPSGVDWIGEIPEHWEVRKLKQVCKININSLDERTNPNYEFDYIDIGSVTYENGIINKEFFLFKNAPSRARRIAKEGDTIVSTVRTYLKAIDFVDKSKSNYIFSTGFAVLEPNNEVYPKYLFSFIKSDAFTEQVSVNSKGMSYPAINSTELGAQKVLYLPYEEQVQIVSYLEKIEEKIAKAISIKEQEIEKLKEYKTVLIDNVVTGKVRVS